MPYRALYLSLWLILFAYWIAGARGNKRTAYRFNPLWRALVVLGVAVLLRFFAGRPEYFQRTFIARSDVSEVAGLIVCAAGVAFAIWARRTLGRNWSGNPTIKEGHELVTRGPYRFVRHPIYTGMLLAAAGTALGHGQVLDLVLLLVALVVVWLKSRVEERLMLRQFPQEYASYRRRTNALIPFLL